MQVARSGNLLAGICIVMKNLSIQFGKEWHLFGEKPANGGNSLAGLIYQLINLNDHEHKWMLVVKNIMVICGIPMADTYINSVNYTEYKKYIRRQCEDLATQSWYTMFNTTSLCDCYMEFKHGLFMESFLRKLKAKHGIHLSRFRCAPYMSSRVRERERERERESNGQS